MAPAALASTSPSLSLDQSAGKAAGSTANLGLDLKFTNTGTDSPDHLTINLPPGLLADASRNGGSCIKTAQVTGSACEVGSGTVTAEADPIPPLLNLPVPVSVPVTFYLVPPPAPGDLAGLAVEGLGEQLGSTGEIKVRPSGDPNGVGVTINLALPDQLPLTLPIIGQVNLAQISRDRDQQHVRRAALPGDVPVDPGEPERARRFLQRLDGPHRYRTARCDRLLLAAVRPRVQGHRSPRRRRPPGHAGHDDHAGCDRGAEQVGHARVPRRHPRTEPRVDSGLVRESRLRHLPDGWLCQRDLAALSGDADRQGVPDRLSERAVADARVPVAVPADAHRGRRSRQELGHVHGPPRYPADESWRHAQRRRQGTVPVDLPGPGEHGDCDAHRSERRQDCQSVVHIHGVRLPRRRERFWLRRFWLRRFWVRRLGCRWFGCRWSGGSTGSSNVVGSGNGSTSQGVTVGTTKLSNGRVSGLSSGHASLSFRLAAAKHAARLGALTIELPAGMSFVGHRVGHKLKVAGVSVTGAKIKSLTLSHGHLVITLRKAVSSLVVKLSASALRESAALRRKAGAHQLKTLHLTVISTNTRGRHATIHVRFTALGL